MAGARGADHAGSEYRVVARVMKEEVRITFCADAAGAATLSAVGNRTAASAAEPALSRA